MKRIQQLSLPTTGLANYLEQEPGEPTWEKFRNHEEGEAYKELQEKLVDLQHRLCGYCEIDLLEYDIQVEHVIPRSDPKSRASEILDISNLMACCKGGTARNLFGPEVGNPDPERFLSPASDNVSCGQAKDHISDSHFIDPRKLPALPSLLRVGEDGTIHADKDACAAAGIPVHSIERTIGILGLNVQRIKASPGSAVGTP